MAFSCISPIILYLTFCLFGRLSSGQDCQYANFTVQPDFNLEKYLGKWYEMKWLSQSYISEDLLFRDYAHNYVMESDGTITVFIKGRDPTTPDKCFRYPAWINQTNIPGKMRFTRWTSGFGSPNITSDYWVMMTDYDNYALVYGCRVPFENGTCDEPDSWIWSRTKSLPESTWTIITQKMEDLCVDPTKYLATQQDNECPECRYKLTEIVKNFEISKYKGEWYELRIYKPNATDGFTQKKTIHSYMKKDEKGLEARITNRNKEGKCTSEDALLRKTKTPGKLILEQNIGTGIRIERDYWIMSSDYDNYAMVYSCLVPGDNLSCKHAELTVMGRETSLKPSVWSMVKQKVVNVCLDPDDYIDISDDQVSDCSSGGSIQRGRPDIVLYSVSLIFMIWKLYYILL